MSQCSCSNECSLSTFYNGFNAREPGVIKKYSYHGLEIYAILKSMAFTNPIIAYGCQRGSWDANQQQSVMPSDDLDEFTYDPKCLVIESNQMLAIGYSNLSNSVNIVLTVFPNVNIVVRNGGKLVVFNNNSLVNYGNWSIENSAVILESPHTASIINSGYIMLKNTCLVGKGTIYNNGTIKANCYSKIILGREKIDLNENTKEATAKPKQVASSYCADELGSKIINSGVISINSYSVFDLVGTLLNGSSDVNCCYLECPDSNHQLDLPKQAVISVVGNSKFKYKFGGIQDSRFVNEQDAILQFYRDTYSIFKVSDNDFNTNVIINRGTMTLNGESSFNSVNLENYHVFGNSCCKPSSSDDPACDLEYNYAKILFTTSNDPPFINNASRSSIIRIAPTCNLVVDGYSIDNYGKIIIGYFQSCDSEDSACTQLETGECATNDCQNYCCPGNTELQTVAVNARFIYGFLSPSSAKSKICFRNFYLLRICGKSIFDFGKNASIVDQGKQVTLVNQGQIINLGFVQVNRNSEIINTPSPFTLQNEDCSIQNGATGKGGAINYASVIYIQKPIGDDLDTGGTIQVNSAPFFAGSKVCNNPLGIIVDWVGYDSEDNYKLVFGLDPGNIKNRGGKVRWQPYPDWVEWEIEAIKLYLIQQNSELSFDIPCLS
jgi:hypothetical protein